MNLKPVALLTLLVMTASPAAQGQIVVDQSTWRAPAGASIVIGRGVLQTFTPAQTGRIMRLDLQMRLLNGPSGDLEVCILETDAAGVPDLNTSLGTVFIPGAQVDANPSEVMVDTSGLNLTLIEETRYAYFLRGANGSSSGTGTRSGNAYSRGQVFDIRSSGLGGPFNGSEAFRTWVEPNYQVNGRARLSIDGVETTGRLPATATGIIGQNSVLSFGGAVAGNAAELVIAVGAPVGRDNPRSLKLASGDVINVDLGSAPLYFNGGTVAVLAPIPALSLTLPAFPAGFEACAQMVALDPTKPSGFSVSQAGHLVVR